MEAYLPTIRAQETLRLAESGQIRLSPRGWYEVVLAATGSEDQATDAHNQAVQAALRRKEDPGETM